MLLLLFVCLSVCLFVFFFFFSLCVHNHNHLPWLQKYLYLSVFLLFSCNSGNFHANCTKCYKFVNKVVLHFHCKLLAFIHKHTHNGFYIHTHCISKDTRHTGNLRSFINVMAPVTPLTYGKGLFVLRLHGSLKTHDARERFVRSLISWAQSPPRPRERLVSPVTPWVSKLLRHTGKAR